MSSPVTDGISFDSSNVVRAPAAVVDFVRRTIEQLRPSSCAYEKRAQRRFDVNIPALFVPLDPDFHAVGLPFEALVRDISAGGLGIVHTRAVTETHLAAKLMMPNSAAMMKMIGEVIRCRPLGRFYDVGLRFVAKIND